MAIDAYLKLDNIEGESTRQGFEKHISLLSFSWGGTQVTSVAGTGGSGAGRATVHPITVQKFMDGKEPRMIKYVPGKLVSIVV